MEINIGNETWTLETVNIDEEEVPVEVIEAVREQANIFVAMKEKENRLSNDDILDSLQEVYEQWKNGDNDGFVEMPYVYNRYNDSERELMYVYFEIGENFSQFVQDYIEEVGGEADNVSYLKKIIREEHAEWVEDANLEENKKEICFISD